MGFPEICDEPTPAAGDNYTATTQLAEGRLTERNRFYITDYHYCVEIFERGLFEPYWVRTNDNGADIYTKSVPPPIMKRLRPAETGYSDDPLPAPDMTATPKSGNEPPTTDSTCNHNTWVRLGGCKMTSDTYGSVTATDPANTAVSGLQDPVNMAVSALQPESTKRASTPELRSSALQHESTKRASIPNYGHPPHVREGYHYSYGILRYTVI